MQDTWNLDKYAEFDPELKDLLSYAMEGLKKHTHPVYVAMYNDMIREANEWREAKGFTLAE